MSVRTGCREARGADDVHDAVPTDEPWARDPYAPAHKRGALANLAEDARFDELFPSHPLSMTCETAHALIDGLEGAC